MRPTHIMKGSPLYLKATDLNVNHILRIASQQHLGWRLTKNWYHSLTKLTPKITYHTFLEAVVWNRDYWLPQNPLSEESKEINHLYLRENTQYWLMMWTNAQPL